MIACTSDGSVLKVGGISADSRMPRRPLVPAPTKTMRPPLRSAVGDHLDADGDALALALHGREHLAIFVDHQIDDVVGGQLVDAEAEGLMASVGSDCHLERTGIRLQF